MAHVSLYRKYRSQTFGEVVGQDHITTTLANALADDRLHHAYLFTGPRGTGKTSTARILAKAVNCVDGPTPTPCNVCVQCTGITAGSSVDVIEIDAASHGGVDDVRDLRDRVAFAPASARMKVYIVDECHMLSTAGWNAFLKTVEEPPGHVLFVFATTEPHKVLDTIHSRTQRFDFKRIGADALAGHLRTIGAAEGLDIAQGAIDLVVHAGDGSARDTLSVLDQVIAFTGRTITAADVADVLGAAPTDLLAEAADFVAGGDVAGVCALIGRLADGGHDLRHFARDAVEHFRRLLLLQVAPEAGLVDGTPERVAALHAQAGRMGRVELLRAVELLAEAQAQMRRGNTRLPLEIALMKAALPEACGDPAALAARMDRLERRSGGSQAVQEPPAQPADAPAPRPQRPTHGPEPRPDAAPEQPLAAPSAATVEGTGQVDLGLVARSWPAIMEGVKNRKIRFHALLTMAGPQDYSDGVLTLAFRPGYGLHAEQCGGVIGQEVITGAVEDVLGVRPSLRCVVDEGELEIGGEQDGDADGTGAREEADVLESEAAAAAGQLPDDGAAHDLALEALTRDLGATVVDESSR